MARKRVWLDAVVLSLLLAATSPLGGSGTSATPALAEPGEDAPYVVQDLSSKLAFSFEAVTDQKGDVTRFHLRGSGYPFVPDGTEAQLPLTPPREGEVLSLPLFRDVVVKGAGSKEALPPIPKPKATGLDPLPRKSHDYSGRAWGRWGTLAHYARVQFQDVYHGIDLVYHANKGQLELDFVIAPGADPRAIHLGLGTRLFLRLDAQGNLILTDIGLVDQFTLKGPVIYQEVDGVRQEVSGRYLPPKRNAIGFQVGPYDTALPLVIHYSMDLPSLSGITAVDASGNIYLSEEGSVTKLSSTGDGLIYTTRLAGSIVAVAVDVDGNAYVTTYLQPDELIPIPYQWDTLWRGRRFVVFVTKLTDTGELVYSFPLLRAFVLGYGTLPERGIALDAKGFTVYPRLLHADAITYYKNTNSAGVRFTYTTSVCPIPGRLCGTYVSGINPDGSRYLDRLNFLGNSPRMAKQIAVDISGKVYIVGRTYLCRLITENAVQPRCGGSDEDSDVIVVKLDPLTGGIIYSTYLGGDGDDFGTSIAVDAEGNAYVTGTTEIPAKRASPPKDFPTEKAWQSEHGGSTDVFVAKLGPEGSLEFSTFLGGRGDDVAKTIHVDAAGNIYVSGSTNSGSFPLQEPLESLEDGDSLSTRSFLVKFARATDLAVTKTGPLGPVIAGAGLSYEFTVTNNGPLDATGVTVIDRLPAGVTFVSATPTQGSCSESEGVVECNLGDVPNGASVTVAVQLTIGSSTTGKVTGTASVTGNQADPDETNNIAAWDTTVTAPPTPTPAPTATLVPTPTPAPTATRTPTVIPTATPAPTPVPETATPQSTSTPAPTNTATPALPTEAPAASPVPDPTKPRPTVAVRPVLPAETPVPTATPAEPVPTHTPKPSDTPPPRTTPTLQPAQTPAPTGGGGCLAQAGEIKAADGVWLLLGLGLMGLVLAGRRKRMA